MDPNKPRRARALLGEEGGRSDENQVFALLHQSHSAVGSSLCAPSSHSLLLQHSSAPLFTLQHPTTHFTLLLISFLVIPLVTPCFTSTVPIFSNLLPLHLTLSHSSSTFNTAYTPLHTPLIIINRPHPLFVFFLTSDPFSLLINQQPTLMHTPSPSITLPHLF